MSVLNSCYFDDYFGRPVLKAVFVTAQSTAYYHVQMKDPAETWTSEGVAFGIWRHDATMHDGQADIAIIYPAVDTFDLRVRCLDGVTVTDWYELSRVGTGSSAPAGGVYARTVTYKEVRDGVIERYSTSSSDLTAVELRRLAQFITAANRQVLMGYPWAELVVTESVTCASGKVLWADIRGADVRKFFTADPRPTTSTALPINEKQPDATGIWLDSGTLATVWAQYVPRPPKFSSVEYDNAATYAVADVCYYNTTGHCYECIAASTGHAPTNTTFWRPLPILWTVAEAVMGFAEAAVYARERQEATAMTVRLTAEQLLNELQFHDCKKRSS